MPAPAPAGAYPLHPDTLIHDALARVLVPGCAAVDATAGNGHDTLFLAQGVGPGGEVWAFDVQAAALEATRARLDAARAAGQALGRVHLVHAGHEDCLAHLPAPPRTFTVAVFNLGYLPGADRTGAEKPRVTSAATTLEALTALMPRMTRGGIVALHAYTGHRGGTGEARALMALCRALPYTEWSVWHTRTLNKTLRSEHVFLLQRHV